MVKFASNNLEPWALLRKHCYLPLLFHVSSVGRLGNIAVETFGVN